VAKQYDGRARGADDLEGTEDRVKMHAWEHVPEVMKGEGKKFRKASPRGWRKDLTPKQAEMVERITVSVMTEFYA
jgi:hypothetical protein